MNLFDAYIARSREIIGDRSPEEAKYDAEVLRWLRKGRNIREAVEAANRRYPAEALAVDESNVEDVASHYSYLLEHENIMKKMGKLAKR